MSETILLKDVEAVYVQWVFGDFKLFDGDIEVSAVGKRNDKDGLTYFVHYVGEDTDWRYGIATDELRLERRAPAQPATADAGLPRTDLDDATLERWPRMYRERATDPIWKDAYTEIARNDMLDMLDVVATLKAKLAAAEAREKMLLASLHNIRDMRVNPTGNDDYDTGRRMGYQITTELAQAAINAHAKALQASAHGKGEAE